MNRNREFKAKPPSLSKKMFSLARMTSLTREFSSLWSLRNRHKWNLIGLISRFMSPISLNQTWFLKTLKRWAAVTQGASSQLWKKKSTNWRKLNVSSTSTTSNIRISSKKSLATSLRTSEYPYPRSLRTTQGSLTSQQTTTTQLAPRARISRALTAPLWILSKNRTAQTKLRICRENMKGSNSRGKA